MKCFYKKTCGSKKPDELNGFNCMATVKGYCPHQEGYQGREEAEKLPEAKQEKKPENIPPIMQNPWVRETIRQELKGHQRGVQNEQS